ncbi:recombinase family protein [Tsukamurella hominis]|uniref:recombinase family protein n=1 Tax=Tsukamurella hominis TaxID=1970232 RepID=UPI0039EB7CE6
MMHTAHPGGRPPLLSLDVVRRIHEMTVAGCTTRQICDALNADEIPTPTGDGPWTRMHIWRQVRTARYISLAAAAA